MKKTIVLAVFLYFLTASGITWSDESKFNLGIYVVVDNMDEAKKFYQQLFEMDPYIDNGDFVGFSLAGSLFSLFTKTAYDHSLTKGNNVVPYIRVSDIDAEFKRVKALGAHLEHEEVQDEGVIKLFMLMDPSGNPIEFYSLATQ